MCNRVERDYIAICVLKYTAILNAYVCGDGAEAGRRWKLVCMYACALATVQRATRSKTTWSCGQVRISFVWARWGKTAQLWEWQATVTYGAFGSKFEYMYMLFVEWSEMKTGSDGLYVWYDVLVRERATQTIDVLAICRYTYFSIWYILLESCCNRTIEQITRLFVCTLCINEYTCWISIELLTEQLNHMHWSVYCKLCVWFVGVHMRSGLHARYL